MFFSQHLFLDSQYWSNKANISDTFFISLSYEGNANDLKIELIMPNLSNIPYLKRKGNKNTKRVTLSVFNEFKTYKFNIKANNIDKIKIRQADSTFFNQNVEFKSFKINDEEILENKKLNSTITVPDSNKTIYTIETECRIAPFDWSFSYKNYIAFITLFIFYLLLFLYVVPKIENCDKNFFRKFVYKNKIELLIFLLSFLIYAAFNMHASLHVNHLGRILNQGFSNQTYMQGDAMWLIYSIYISQAKQFHPYFFLPIYPLYEFLLLITQNLYFSLSIIWYSFASLSVVFLYKIFNLISSKLKIIKTLLILIFAFSLSQILMSYIFDLYIIAGFYLSLLTYLIFKEIKNKEYDIKNLFTIAVVCAFMFGVNMVNLITCFILISSIFIIKKINKDKCKILIKFILIVIILVTFFISFKSITNYNASYNTLFLKKNKIERYVTDDLKYNWSQFYKETLLNPLVYSPYSYNPAYLFYIILILMIIYNFYLFSKNKALNREIYYTTLFAIFYNYIANFFWCPDLGFIFSQNFFILLFVLFLLSIENIDKYLKTKNINFSRKLKIFIVIYLVLLIFFEIILNTHTVNKQHKNALKYNQQNSTLNSIEVNDD